MAASYDVVIVGAGPAGAAVAARLSQHGRSQRILVLDRYSFPRDKPCGGALTGHIDTAMADVGLSLRVDHVASAAATVSFGTFSRTIEMGRPVCMVRRVEFDADLVAQVQELGVEVVLNEGVRGYSTAADGLVVTTSRGREISTKVLIGADGAASVVRKQLSATRPKQLPHRLFMAELSRPSSMPASSSMLYDFTAMARGLRGYVWIFPAPGDRINVGLMHYPAYRRGGRDLSHLLTERLAELGVDLPERTARGWPVWGYDPRTPVSAPRVLVVGDAAGIDGLTGEGIAVALEQATIAADLVDQGLRNGDLSFASYRKRLRRATVGRELALDRWLARLLYNCDRDETSWQRWLSLVLFDPKVIEMYASRVDGCTILADQKPRLYAALLRHAVSSGKRRSMLRSALTPPA